MNELTQAKPQHYDSGRQRWVDNYRLKDKDMCMNRQGFSLDSVQYLGCALLVELRPKEKIIHLVQFSLVFTKAFSALGLMTLGLLARDTVC